ncbi:immunity 49 family protein, partial [Streptomyces sp. NPDC048567]|uniref:immunity 49 family protein n=1 Tax=Streptomyces sp. NPDC048567 TaxID=3365570 RepID=UPI00371838E7
RIVLQRHRRSSRFLRIKQIQYQRVHHSGGGPLICRDQPRLTQLSQIPLEQLRSPQALADEYLHHWIDTLQTWWLRGPALAEALQLHKAYWTLNEDRATDVDGSIALGPLAIACLAHDADFPLDIESDYLPKHLLQRTWIGEFPT